MSSNWLVVSGPVIIIFGLVAAGIGWHQRKQYQLIAGTPTTDIRNIDSEGLVELKGTISGSADGSGFVSPIGQTDETVFAAWLVQEWNEHTPNSGSNWKLLASGTDSETFHLDDGTDQVRVVVEDHPTVTQKIEDPVIEEVDVESETPAHIEEFVQETPDLSEQSGSITNRVDVGNAHGDRKYTEWTLGLGDEIYILGHVHAAEGATTPLHPEDAIVRLTDGEKSILSDMSEEELTLRGGTSYRLAFAGGAIALILGVGLIVAGTTPLF